MQSFEYEPLPGRVVFGPGAVAAVPAEVERLAAERVLVVCGAHEAEVAERVAAALPAARVLAGARVHVPVELAERARAEAASHSAGCVVAIGGGSAIGLAKAVALTARLPVVAVPTTYSGSEMTPIWGTSEGGRKQTGRDLAVLPRAVVYDPELSLSLPAAVSAASGLNAVAHCVEALWTERTNALVCAVAEEGLRTLAPALRAVVAAPGQLAARTDALRGAWLAGVALAAAGTALHHRLCHVLGGLGLPHAEVHAALLPHVVAFHADAAPEALARVARALAAEDAVTGLRTLARDLGAPSTLSSLGMTEPQLDEAATIMAAAPPAHPRQASRAEIRGILERAFG